MKMKNKVLETEGQGHPDQTIVKSVVGLCAKGSTWRKTGLKSDELGSLTEEIFKHQSVRCFLLLFFYPFTVKSEDRNDLMKDFIIKREMEQRDLRNSILP